MEQSDFYFIKPFVIDELLNVIKTKIQQNLFISEMDIPPKRFLISTQPSDYSILEEERRIVYNKFLYQEYVDNQLIFENDTTTPITTTFFKTLHKLVGINSVKKERIVHTIINASLSIQEKYLEFILYELIENALKFSNESVVKVSGKIIANKYYELTIKDHGIGFSAEELLVISSKCVLKYRLFEEEDLGIGLFLSTKFIENAEGIIKITSEKNRGTTVMLYFPMVKENCITFKNAV